MHTCCMSQSCAPNAECALCATITQMLVGLVECLAAPSEHNGRYKGMVAHYNQCATGSGCPMCTSVKRRLAERQAIRPTNMQLQILFH